MEKGCETEVSGKRKRSAPSKYNKLTKEQKITLIKEWKRTHLSYAWIAEKYSELWGIRISKRGIGDLVKQWRENGKIRGYSNDAAVPEELLSTLKMVCHVCQENRYAISETELHQIQKWIEQVSVDSESDVTIYPIHHTIKLLANQVSSVLKASILSSNLSSLLSLFDDYPPSSIFCLDSFFFLPNASVSAHLSTDPAPSTPYIVWNAFSLDGTFPFHFTERTTLPSLLQLLDSNVTRETLVFLHCIEPIFESIILENGYQKVTFCPPSPLSSLSSSIPSTGSTGSTGSTECGDPSVFPGSEGSQQRSKSPTFSFRFLRIHEMNRDDAFALLPSYRGLSQLFRLCVKCVLVLSFDLERS